MSLSLPLNLVKLTPETSTEPTVPVNCDGEETRNNSWHSPLCNTAPITLPHTHSRQNKHTRSLTYAHTQTPKYTIIPSPHTLREHIPAHKFPLFSLVQSLSYMLSPRPYKADPLCSALTYFSLCLYRILALAFSQCALPIHTTGLSVLLRAGEVCYLQEVSFSGTEGGKVCSLISVTWHALEGRHSNVCFLAIKPLGYLWTLIQKAGSYVRFLHFLQTFWLIVISFFNIYLHLLLSLYKSNFWHCCSYSK